MAKEKEMLSDAIVESINNLRSLEVGSQGRETEVENVQKLYKLMIEEAKLEQSVHELEFKADIEDAKFKLEREKLEEEKKTSKIDKGLRYGFEALNLAFLARWLRKGFKFEETGTFTSSMMRQLVSSLFKRKR